MVLMTAAFNINMYAINVNTLLQYLEHIVIILNKFYFDGFEAMDLIDLLTTYFRYTT